MPADDTFYEQAALWPVALLLEDGTWFTLWGGGGADDDLLLAQGNQIVLSASLETLYRRLPVENVNVRELPTYEQLAILLENGTWPAHDVHKVYPLVRLSTWLRVGPGGWSIKQVSEAMDSLNLLWDAARTRREEEWRSRLLVGGGHLSMFLDRLYEVEGLLQRRRPSAGEAQAHVVRVLGTCDGPALADEFDAAVDRLFGPAERWL
jgi:hypothetical protein